MFEIKAFFPIKNIKKHPTNKGKNLSILGLKQTRFALTGCYNIWLFYLLGPPAAAATTRVGSSASWIHTVAR